MSGRWVDTMKTPTMRRSKHTVRGYEEPHSDKGCFADTATMQGIRTLLTRCLDKRDEGHEAFVADHTQAFLKAEVREGEQLHAQPLEGWNQTCGLESAQGHAESPDITEMLLRTFVWQVERTWLCSRRARSVSVCEH